MNDDPIPSFAPPRRPPTPHPEDPIAEYNEQQQNSSSSSKYTTHGGDTNAGGQSSAAAEVATETSSQQSRRLRRQRRRKRKEGLAKKLEFLVHLHKSLDMLVFAYLCVLYYMECSIFFLLLRLFPHYALISHKDVTIILPNHRPYVIAILGPNMLCMLSHLLFSLPEAGEATRGYLHGGAIIDFIGQRPPIWKSGLLYYDAVILVLQCLMLAVHLDKERIRRAISPSLRALTERAAVARAAASVAAAAAATTTGGGRSDSQVAGGRRTTTRTSAEEDEEDSRNGTQDHDAEERGVLRDDQALAGEEEEEDDANETQPLTGGGSDNVRRQDEQRMGMGHSQLRGNADLVDVLQSGNGMLGPFHVVHAVRTAGDDSGRDVASLREYAAALTGAMAADRRARLAALAV